MAVATALTIAGSDSGGGAGIQADLKAFSALGVYGASAITLVTAQNTRGVLRVDVLDPALVADQIAAVLDDIRIDAVKIGALGSAPVIEAVAGALSGYEGPVVLDPVMVAKSGDALLVPEAAEALKAELLPRATLVTPNLPEAAALTGMAEAGDPEGMTEQARAIVALGAGAALVKGGHGSGSASTDILVAGSAPVAVFPADRVRTQNTHGTGCSLSAAIAARLALGDDLPAAIKAAKSWLTKAIAAADALGVGTGHGPVHHFHALWPAARP